MRFQSKLNIDSNRYYILDTITDKRISDKEYDIVIQIYEDSYAVVGNIDSYRESPFTERVYFKYGLIDMSGKVVLDMHYKFIYIHAK